MFEVLISLLRWGLLVVGTDTHAAVRHPISALVATSVRPAGSRSAAAALARAHASSAWIGILRTGGGVACRGALAARSAAFRNGKRTHGDEACCQYNS